MKEIIPIERIENRILLVRGQKVMLDRDLAELYGTSTKRFNEQVRRNRNRFPADFMFQMNNEEVEVLRSQIATSNGGRGGRRYAPYVFTEHGALMAASVLNTPRAIEVSVFVVRAFVRLREMLTSHKELLRKLEEMEKKYDVQFQVVFDAIRQLMAPPDKKVVKIGFRVKEKKD